MKLHGIIFNFPSELKALIAVFLAVLSVGFFTGLNFVNNTTSMNAQGVERNYLGNEDDENAEIMKFKKNEREMLTLIHNHILSLSVIFFLVAVILSTTSIHMGWKLFLMLEPFLSLILTFGGLYIMWLGVNWFKYIVMLSGILMTFCYVSSIIIIFKQLYFTNNKAVI
ncbi:MAG TPA: hypothetical protein VJ970_07160 [Flavobacteriaceae bacterium]|nr:hypothetical protein [Flavobacteriaceae bacterium]